MVCIVLRMRSSKAAKSSSSSMKNGARCHVQRIRRDWRKVAATLSQGSNRTFHRRLGSSLVSQAEKHTVEHFAEQLAF